MCEKTTVGIQESDIKGIVSVLQHYYKITKVILFGSRAKGTYTNGSDIDLALDGSELTLHDVLDISMELEELNLPYKFDLIIRERIKEEALLDHISRVGIVLFERVVQ